MSFRSMQGREEVGKASASRVAGLVESFAKPFETFVETVTGSGAG